MYDLKTLFPWWISSIMVSACATVLFIAEFVPYIVANSEIEFANKVCSSNDGLSHFNRYATSLKAQCNNGLVFIVPIK